MKKMSLIISVLSTLTFHCNTFGMMLIKALPKYSKPTSSRKYCRIPLTEYINRLSYDDVRSVSPLFSAHEELYQTTIKNHAKHDTLLKEIATNQQNILKYQKILSQRLDLIEHKQINLFRSL